MSARRISVLLCVAMLATHSMAVSARADAVARELAAPKGHSFHVRCVSWSPDGKILASASNDAVRLWAVAPPE